MVKKSKKPLPELTMDVTNYDHVIPKHLDMTYRNKYENAPKHPARILIVGPSNCGKSNVAINLIMKFMVFDKLWIFCKDPLENKYQYLKLKFQQVAEALSKELGKTVKLDDIFKLSSDINDLPDIDKIDRTKQHLMLFDDFVVDKSANSKIENIFIRGRKSNITSIYLSQSMHDTTKMIRLQCSHLFIFDVKSKRELTEISKTFCSDLDYPEFRKLYQSAVGKPYSFLMIDNTQPAHMLSKKYRCGFDNFAVIK